MTTTEGEWPRLEQHPRLPGCWSDAAQSVGSCRLAAAASPADIYPSPAQVVLRSRGPGGVGPVRTNPQRIKTDAWGDGRSLAMKNDGGLYGPGGGHDPWHHDGRRFEVATPALL